MLFSELPEWLYQGALVRGPDRKTSSIAYVTSMENGPVTTVTLRGHKAPIPIKRFLSDFHVVPEEEEEEASQDLRPVKSSKPVPSAEPSSKPSVAPKMSERQQFDLF